MASRLQDDDNADERTPPVEKRVAAQIEDRRDGLRAPEGVIKGAQ